MKILLWEWPIAIQTYRIHLAGKNNCWTCRRHRATSSRHCRCVAPNFFWKPYVFMQSPAVFWVVSNIQMNCFNIWNDIGENNIFFHTHVIKKNGCHHKNLFVRMAICNVNSSHSLARSRRHHWCRNDNTQTHNATPHTHNINTQHTHTHIKHTIHTHTLHTHTHTT